MGRLKEIKGSGVEIENTCGIDGVNGRFCLRSDAGAKAIHLGSLEFCGSAREGCIEGWAVDGNCRDEGSIARPL